MVEKYLEKSIGDLFELLPNGWERVVLYSEIDPLHYNIFFYVKYNGSYYQCYNLEKLCNTTGDEVDQFAEKWHEIALKHKKKEEWSAYTVTIENSGKFEVEYAYEDEFDLDSWKAQYLQ